MNALLDLQRRFQAHVLGSAPPLADAVDPPGADASTRLRIYVDAYRLRLIDVLGNDFPGLRWLAGDDGFDRLCRACIEARPSQHFNLRWYGAALADFLESGGSERPELAEMARFEWNLTLVFDARDEPIVTEADVAALAPEHWPAMQPRSHGAIRRQRCRWNTAAIRAAIDRGAAPPVAQRLDLAEERIIWRRRRDVRHRALEVDEAAALDAIGDGATFGDLCELLCGWHAQEQVALRAAALLRRWIAEQWLTALLAV
ncbi:MAG: hypothetical protein K0Q76_3805 [Panacagrimonas sp.]|jgi:hypothetical protein|nr:DNA-binding domain-containing protein [Panacagrimonas sp.]MCC2658697.1 hypothetical protein [Panacagrimonas sp.]